LNKVLRAVFNEELLGTENTHQIPHFCIENPFHYALKAKEEGKKDDQNTINSLKDRFETSALALE